MSLFSISFKLFICKSMKKKNNNNNLQSCFFKKMDIPGLHLTCILKCKITGQNPVAMDVFGEF